MSVYGNLIQINIENILEDYLSNYEISFSNFNIVNEGFNIKLKLKNIGDKLKTIWELFKKWIKEKLKNIKSFFIKNKKDINDFKPKDEEKYKENNINDEDDIKKEDYVLQIKLKSLKSVENNSYDQFLDNVRNHVKYCHDSITEYYDIMINNKGGLYEFISKEIPKFKKIDNLDEEFDNICKYENYFINGKSKIELYNNSIPLFEKLNKINISNQKLIRDIEYTITSDSFVDKCINEFIDNSKAGLYGTNNGPKLVSQYMSISNELQSIIQTLKTLIDKVTYVIKFVNNILDYNKETVESSYEKFKK